ncbi:unnamed protein product [Gordionus sp. m RMFG-2023]
MPAFDFNLPSVSIIQRREEKRREEKRREEKRREEKRREEKRREEKRREEKRREEKRREEKRREEKRREEKRREENGEQEKTIKKDEFIYSYIHKYWKKKSENISKELPYHFTGPFCGFIIKKDNNYGQSDHF